MSIEENKLQENAEAVQPDANPEGNKKQLSKGALIGIIAGAAAALVAIIVAIILIAGGNGNKGPQCTDHVDANDDFKCDVCGIDFEDGREIVSANIAFVVRVNTGSVISGVEFSLVSADNTYTLVTDVNGSAATDIVEGKYTLEYNYDTVPEGFFQNEFELQITKDTGAFILTLNDNNPDGSIEKPFYISEDATEVSFKPSEELYFNYRGASVKYLVIENADVTVNYNGETYEPVDGVINILITPELGVSTIFTVKNGSDQSITTSVALIAPLGSSENPIEIESDSVSATIPAEGSVHYSWTATTNGVLVVTIENEKGNSINVTRILPGDIPVSSTTYEHGIAYMTVSMDEVISISVSTQNKEETVVNFSLVTYEGSETDPMPEILDLLEIVFVAQNEVLYFATEAGKTVTIESESPFTVIVGDETYATESGKITVTIPEGVTVFSVQNNAEKINRVVISF